MMASSFTTAGLGWLRSPGAHAPPARPQAAADACAGLFLPPGRLKELESVVAGLAGGTAVTAVTGPRGAGKTALVHAAIALLADQPLRVIRIRSPQGVPLSLNRLMAQVLGVPDSLPKIDEMRGCEMLFSPPAGERATVVVIDDADAIQPDALCLLGMLCASAGITGHAVRLLLAGMPGLSDVLDGAGTWSLRGQAVTRVALAPYSELEARGFIAHWLGRGAGRAQPVFQDDALREIIDRGGGLPGATGSILETVLKAARGRRGRHVTRQMVCRALDAPPAAGGAPWHGLTHGKLLLLLLLAILLRGLFAATWMAERRHGPVPAAETPPGHAVTGSAATQAEPAGGSAPDGHERRGQAGPSWPAPAPNTADQPDGQGPGTPEHAQPQPDTAGADSRPPAAVRSGAAAPVTVPQHAGKSQPVPSTGWRHVHPPTPDRAQASKKAPGGARPAPPAQAPAPAAPGQPRAGAPAHRLFVPSDSGG
jgi:type II secretory pathway predicted ATPase ExeA